MESERVDSAISNRTRVKDIKRNATGETIRSKSPIYINI